LTVTNIQDIHSLDVRSAASGSIPERRECMNVRRRDTPYDRAPTAIGRTAYRGLDLVPEVGEGPKYTLGKGSHGRPPTGRGLGHSRVMPLDVIRQESDEIIEIPGVPRLHEPLRQIYRRRATHRLYPLPCLLMHSPIPVPGLFGNGSRPATRSYVFFKARRLLLLVSQRALAQCPDGADEAHDPTDRVRQ